jgi:hypothetical protein
MGGAGSLRSVDQASTPSGGRLGVEESLPASGAVVVEVLPVVVVLGVDGVVLGAPGDSALMICWTNELGVPVSAPLE